MSFFIAMKLARRIIIFLQHPDKFSEFREFSINKSYKTYPGNHTAPWRQNLATGSFWLYHPLDGITNPKHKLLHFFTTKTILQREKGTSF
jgi:hypothetical protein